MFLCRFVNGLLIAAALLIFAPLAFAQGAGSRVKIGAIYGLSGPLSEMSADFRDGAILAIEDFNKRNKFELVPIFEDSKWQPKEAVAVFQKLSDVEKVKFFHVTGASISLAVKPLSEEKKSLLFASASHPGITADSHLVLRHGNSAEYDARILSDAIDKRSPKTVAALYAQNDWGEVFNEELSKELKKANNLHYRSVSFLPEDMDFRSSIISLLASKPSDFVVIALGVQAGIIIKQLKELRYAGRIIANNGLVLSDESFKVLRENGIRDFDYETYPELPSDFALAFAERFHRQAGYWALCAYTDYELLGYAIKNSGQEVSAVASFIKNLGVFQGRFQTLKISSKGDITVDTILRRWK